MPVKQQQIRERPILFSAPMVRAILRGDKTQTRRVVKWPAYFGFTEPSKATAFKRIALMPPRANGQAYEWRPTTADGSWLEPMACPYGDAGDRLWVKETYASNRQEQVGTGAVRWEHPDGTRCGALYRADAISESAPGMGWRPSIHMPRCLSRIDLEIVRVRAERLHQITEDDARSEGTGLLDPQPGGVSVMRLSHRDAFRHLWGAINGAESWDANPWVWVVEFKRVRP